MPIDWTSLGTDLVTAFGETFLMVSIASVLAIAIGLPLGFLLHVTSRKLFCANRFAHVAGNFLVNVVRSVPFVILLVLVLVLLPLTQWVLGTTIDPAAASVAVAVAVAGFLRGFTVTLISLSASQPWPVSSAAAVTWPSALATTATRPT